MPERSRVRKGNRHYHKGDYKPAIERYTQALTLAPESPEALYDLGNAFYKAEMFDKAEQTLARAAADTLRTDSERAEAFYNLGNAQFKQQKYREALESYRRAMLFDPADMEAKYNYAYTKKLLDDNRDQNDDRQQDDDRNRDDDRQQSSDDPQNPNNDGKPRDDRQDPSGQDAQQESGGQEDDRQEGDAEPQPVPAGISEQEQQQMLDAIQAQEDKTQDKLKEKQGRVVRGKKNW